MASTELLRLENIWVNYEGRTVLEDINLSVDREDFLGIIGPNGGGKTTLLKVILGLLNPERGRLLWCGKPTRPSRSIVGYVPQRGLFDSAFPISVEEVVLMGRYPETGLFHRYRREDKAEAEKALVSVGMQDYRKKQIGNLSGGELQRVMIARALVNNPVMLLLDEPTSGIDPAMQEDFYELLTGLKTHRSIIMVTHDVGAISIYVNKIACLNRRLFYHGSGEISEEILEQTYQCPVQLITHGKVPHRVLKEH